MPALIRIWGARRNADHAAACKAEGYTHYKIHPTTFGIQRPAGLTRDVLRISNRILRYVVWCATPWAPIWCLAMTLGHIPNMRRSLQGLGASLKISILLV